MMQGALAQLHMTGVSVMCRADLCRDMCCFLSSVVVSIYSCWSLPLSRDTVLARCAASDSDASWIQLVHGLLKDTLPSSLFSSGRIIGISCILHVLGGCIH